MSMVPVYAFLRHLGKVLDFHGENPATRHLTFATKIRYRFALNDMESIRSEERRVGKKLGTP